MYKNRRYDTCMFPDCDIFEKPKVVQPIFITDLSVDNVHFIKNQYGGSKHKKVKKWYERYPDQNLPIKTKRPSKSLLGNGLLLPKDERKHDAQYEKESADMKKHTYIERKSSAFQTKKPDDQADELSEFKELLPSEIFKYRLMSQK